MVVHIAENKALKEVTQRVAQALERAKQPREDLSGSGRGGDRLKRAKSLVEKASVLRYSCRCEAAVNNGSGQCFRSKAPHSRRMCKQHYEMFCKQQEEIVFNA